MNDTYHSETYDLILQKAVPYRYGYMNQNPDNSNGSPEKEIESHQYNKFAYIRECTYDSLKEHEWNW